MGKIGSRKLDHILIALRNDVESKVKNGFEDMTLLHRALPEVDKDGIDISVDFLGKRFNAPIFIAGMTGGHEKAKRLNENLAIAAQELGIAMGVGSQRAAIEDESLVHTYSIAREVAPDAFLIGNLGAVQFTRGYGLDEAKKAIEMIDADALAIHLNPLHEAIQPEGDLDFKGVLVAIEKLKGLKVPIIAKETGAGIAREEVKALEKAGVSAIDVGGLGGTSFAAVEYYRSKKNREIGKKFWDWGIPTAISTIEALEYTKLPIISTGGIRDGIEVAKALALGATACGLALPLLDRALKSSEHVVDKISEIIEELKIAMFLSGSESIEDLKKADLIVTGRTREWLEVRGIDCKKYANRRKL
ncbi:MAG: type 2 isopentenyl-diphosphate Delta-isomerase [Candidatus Hydrothermarchaeales archaeon]